MELYPYLYSLVLYRHPGIPDFDIAVGMVAGNDDTEEWLYYGLPGGITIVENYLGEPIDIAEFWEKHVLMKVLSEQALIDKYIELLDTKYQFLLYEPLIRRDYTVQTMARSIEEALHYNAYLLQNGEQRLDYLLKK